MVLKNNITVIVCYFKGFARIYQHLCLDTVNPNVLFVLVVDSVIRCFLLRNLSITFPCLDNVLLNLAAKSSRTNELVAWWYRICTPSFFKRASKARSSYVGLSEYLLSYFVYPFLFRP